MFENVLGQPAAFQLIQDIEAGLLAPAMLFSGPEASGKGTAALELGRIISCESDDRGMGGPASWNCLCPACRSHRLLIHPDMLCLGSRPFSAEIAASTGALLRESAVSRETGNSSSRILFIRSIRKLLSRFNPLLWEDDPKGGKIAPLVNSLEEDLDELDALSSPERSILEKLTEGMLKTAIKLESEGLGETIPIAQIRRAAWWSRLAPLGRGKLLIIENSDRMQEEGRNSLLKLLEEPPGRVHIVLTTTIPGSLLPTMLSRLRPYRFSSRGAAVEGDVIRRVFRDHDYLEKNAEHSAAGQGPEKPEKNNRLSEYLDSFLPVSGDTLEILAAYFAASVAYRAALLSRKQGRPIPEEVVLLGKATAPRVEAAGLGRPGQSSGAVIALILEKAGGFEIRSLFSRFLYHLLEQVSLGLKQAPSSFLPSLAYNEIWKKSSLWAQTSVGVYKLRPAQAMEKIFTDLSRGMSEL